MNTLLEVCEWLAEVAPEIVKHTEEKYYQIKIGEHFQGVSLGLPIFTDYATVEYALRELATKRYYHVEIFAYPGYPARVVVLNINHNAGGEACHDHAAIALASAIRQTTEQEAEALT